MMPASRGEALRPEMFNGTSSSVVSRPARLDDRPPIPLTPPEIAGWLNLRGRIVTSVELRVRPRPADAVQAYRIRHFFMVS